MITTDFLVPSNTDFLVPSNTDFLVPSNTDFLATRIQRKWQQRVLKNNKSLSRPTNQGSSFYQLYKQQQQFGYAVEQCI
jgi:hypothetical protein